MDAVKNNPKTTIAGISAAAIAIIQALAPVFGWNLTPEHYAAFGTITAAIVAVMGLIGKDGNKS